MGSVSTGPMGAMPALLTRAARERPPSLACTSANATGMVSSFATSINTGTMLFAPAPPAAEATIASASAALRTPAKTRKPWAARASAAWLPMPVLQPVMKIAEEAGAGTGMLQGGMGSATQVPQ